MGWTLFAVENPLMDYTADNETNVCEDMECEKNQKCSCSKCLCCSVCSALCGCPMATEDPNKKMAEILGFGDFSYK